MIGRMSAQPDLGNPERLGPTRAEVLQRLRNHREPLTVAQLAAELGLHVNTVRFHLDALTDSGLAERTTEQRNGPGRPSVLYQAVAGLGNNHYQDLATALVRHMVSVVDDPSEEALGAGRAWGQRLREQRAERASEGPMDRLLGGMTELGYQPEFRSGTDPAVAVVPCPFMDLSEDRPEVICQLHRGLAEGLLGQDSPWEVTGISPFVTSTCCLIQLRALGTGTGDA